MLAWGSAPPGQVKKILLALKARFNSDAISFIIRAMPQSLSKVILHIILAPRIVSLGSNHTCGRACMLIWPQSAATSEPNSCTLAVLLITFTLLPRCRELFPRLISSSG